jgi:predicted DNA-binding antitoxin AbrB/MazE fold protein
MTIHCTAIYENGVLRPLAPTGLMSGEKVEVIIVSERRNPAQRTPADILAAIAAMPVEGSGDPFTSRDHDKVLYGDKGAR